MGVLVRLAGRKQLSIGVPSLSGWIKTRLGNHAPVRLAGTKYHKCWRPGQACLMKAGSALVPQFGLLDGAKLSIGALVWPASCQQATQWCPAVVRWMK